MKNRTILVLLSLFLNSGIYSQNFFQDLWQGNIESIKEQVEKNPSLIHEISQWGLTPIQTVTAWGHRNHVEIIDLLIDHGADINQLSNDGRPAIHFAIKSADPELVKYLIEKGADINIVDGDNNSSLY